MMKKQKSQYCKECRYKFLTSNIYCSMGLMMSNKRQCKYKSPISKREAEVLPDEHDDWGDRDES